MTNKRRWTLKEDVTLVQAIKANPQSVKQACSFVAVKINRTEAACAARWYNALSDPRSPHYIHNLLTLEDLEKDYSVESTEKKTKKFIPNFIQRWVKKFHLCK